MSKVLVTGGAGFIGSHCVDMLLERGVEVAVLDIKSKNEAVNLTHCLDRITYVEGDVRVAEQVAAAIVGCDAVLHLAAIVSVPMSIEDPIESHNTNVTGMLLVLEAARQAGIKRFVYASSAAVYGDVDAAQLSEECAGTPTSPYGWHKLINEQYAALYANQYGLYPIGLRFFNVYGRRQDPSSPYSGVISIFTKRAQEQAPLTIYGDGSATRDFVHVADVAAICIASLEDTEATTGVYNVGTGEAVSIKVLAEQILSLSGSGEIVYKPERPGDIKRSCADVKKLQSYLGSIPPTPLAEGLKDLLGST